MTNPPFSLLREYVTQLVEYKKKFLIIGNMNAITYKEIFPLIMSNRLWLGVKSGNMAFQVPDTYEERKTRFWVDNKGNKWRSLGNICWFTNLDHNKRHEKLDLYMHYYGNEEHYPKYDNYDAINVNKVCEIPLDYFEINDDALLTKNEDDIQFFTEQNRTEQNRTEQNRTEQNRTCSGLIGVPISFLDKYNSEQFEIVDKKNDPVIDRKRIYKRIIIKAKKM